MLLEVPSPRLYGKEEKYPLIKRQILDHLKSKKSQIFEGVTEDVIVALTANSSWFSNQKGPINQAARKLVETYQQTGELKNPTLDSFLIHLHDHYRREGTWADELMTVFIATNSLKGIGTTIA